VDPTYTSQSFAARRVISSNTGLVSVLGVPYEPCVGPVAVAATWTLGCAAIIFVLAADEF
jgi:hypothetical protein